jgi:hypothetical protein
MKKTTPMLGAALLAAVGLAAHDGHTHKAMGTVGRVEKTRFELKDTEGKVLSFALSDWTKVERGGAASAAARLEAGERVVVEYEEWGATPTAAKVRVGASGPTGAAKAEVPTSAPCTPRSSLTSRAAAQSATCSSRSARPTDPARNLPVADRL